MKLSVRYLLLIFLVSGCATSHKLSMDRKRQTVQGFEFAPPQAGEWYIMKNKNPNIKVFAKKITDLKVGDPAHSFVFSVQVGQMDVAGKSKKSILKLIRQSKDWQNIKSKFRLINNKSIVINFKKTKCLRFDTEYEDLKLRIITMHGLFCLHPKKSGQYIDIAYSQRYVKGRAALNVKKESEEFVNSLEFQ